MPKKVDWMPTRDDDFFNFQGNLDGLVTANATPWGIPPADVTEINTLRATYEPLYHTSQNKTTRNQGDVLAHRRTRTKYEKRIRKLARNYLMYNPLLTKKDKSDLGLTIHDTEPSPSAPINDVPIIGLKGLGGGDIEVRCRVRGDQTRASMHSDANLVEYRFVTVQSDEAAPDAPEDCTKGSSQTKAKFVIKAGARNSGKRFYGFFRWLNNRRPRQEGPWTNVQTVVIG